MNCSVWLLVSTCSAAHAEAVPANTAAAGPELGAIVLLLLLLLLVGSAGAGAAAAPAAAGPGALVAFPPPGLRPWFSSAAARYGSSGAYCVLFGGAAAEPLRRA